MIESIIGHFLDLDTFCCSFVETGCERIKKHMLDIVLFYQKELMKILKNEFDLVLKSVSYPYNREIAQQNVLSMKAPMITSNSGGVDIRNYPSITDASEVKLRSCVKHLIKIESCDSRRIILNHAKNENNENNIINSIVIILLVKPLEKRFKYHFFGQRKTNNLDKVKSN